MENINRSRVDVWGISDLDLFREGNTILDNRVSSSPSFTIIQTAGNHRPYTIPSDDSGFEIKQVEKSVLKAAGFKSEEQYNAVRLLAKEAKPLPAMKAPAATPAPSIATMAAIAPAPAIALKPC